MITEKKELLYYWVKDLTQELADGKLEYETFLIQLHDKYYPDAFYFRKPDRIIIRTHDNYSVLYEKIETVKEERLIEEPNIEIFYKLLDAMTFKLAHPTLDDEWITGEKFYEWLANRHFLITKVDLRKSKQETEEPKMLTWEDEDYPLPF